MALWRDCSIGCSEDHEEEGIVQRYVHLTREFEAPASYHVFSLLSAISAATARRVVIDRGGYRLWPNLYILLHGPSGLGKGIASDHAISLVRRAMGSGFREYPDDLTAEGLFRLMYDQSQKNEPSIGLVYADEFADLLGGQDYKSEFAKRLTKLYACQDKTGTGRSGTGERWAEQVFLVILGCSQEDWLRTLPIHAVKGGLFARIITVPEYEKRHWKYKPNVDMELAQKIQDELAERLAEIGDGGVAVQDEDAAKFGEEWYLKEAERWPKLDPIILPWCQRRLDHAFKLAYLNTLLEGDGGPLRIDKEGMEWGIEVVEWLTPRIERAFQRMNETKSGEIHRIIMEQVEHAGGMLSESTLRLGLGNRYNKRQIDEGIIHLLSCDEVVRQERHKGRGKMDWVLIRASRAEADGPSRVTLPAADVPPESV